MTLVRAAIADCAAALTGLLLVAMTVARRHSPADRPVVIEQVRAAASILAFTNALAVSLFGLVPGNNIGYPDGPPPASALRDPAETERAGDLRSPALTGAIAGADDRPE